MTIERDSVQIAEEPSPKELLREFYAFKGIDIDQRVPRTIRRITWEEKNRDHEQWHRELEAFLKQRDSPTDSWTTITS